MEDEQFKISRSRLPSWLGRVVLVCIWLAILGVCVYHRDAFTVENIVSYSPSSPILAVLVLLALFGLKSLSIFIYCGIFYAAAGILFPLPEAILVNVLGTMIMVSLPYAIGRNSGSQAAERLTKKYPKLEKVKEFRQQNDFFFSLLTRIFGFVPADIISLYMGVIGVSYGKYLMGCLVGMLPVIILFPIMGMSITDPTSPTFLLAFGGHLAIMVCALLGFLIYRKFRAAPSTAIQK